MRSQPLKNVLSQLKTLMCGFNYEVTFGLDLFNECSTIEEFSHNLKACYPKSDPQNTVPIVIVVDEFWQEINYAFDYRGDETAGLELNTRQEEELQKIHNEYKAFLAQYLAGPVTIYSYPDEKGIPGYPVWWDFRFIIFTEDGTCLFLYGSASD